MAAVAADASPIMDSGLSGPVPARIAGPAAAERSPAVVPRGGAVRSWPLLVLAAPAAAEVFSGWVGIAQKTGFGLVSPLPGIWPALHLDTAITLPVGRRGLRRVRAARLAGHRAGDQRPDPPVRQIVGEHVRAHGAAGPAAPRRCFPLRTRP